MTNELAQRVEAASGADRELDCRIWCEINNLDFDTAAAVVPDFDQWRAPSYTASIDAALTLVPEGWNADLGLRPAKPWFWAELARLGQDPLLVSKYSGRSAAAPALAICAAALRARQEKIDG